MTFIDRKDITY